MLFVYVCCTTFVLIFRHIQGHSLLVVHSEMNDLLMLWIDKLNLYSICWIPIIIQIYNPGKVSDSQSKKFSKGWRHQECRRRQDRHGCEISFTNHIVVHVWPCYVLIVDKKGWGHGRSYGCSSSQTRGSQKASRRREKTSSSKSKVQINRISHIYIRY